MTETAETRETLMERHRVACAVRDSSLLGSDAYRKAAEEIAEIEVAIAKLEEPPVEPPVG